MKTTVSRAVAAVVFGLAGPIPAFAADPAPKLILQITVNQLRGDLLACDLVRMGDGGVRYLLDQGVVYLDAHHAHPNTETIVGHATLATGAHPAAHGMVGNVWFDRDQGRLVYNVEDPDFPILSAGAGGETAVDRKRSIA